VFISHAWNYSSDYHRVVDFLNAAPRFAWLNLSVPEHDPLHAGDDELEYQLRNQMRDADVFVIIGGMYTNHSGWIDFEVGFARRIGRPIILLRPRGSQRLPRSLQLAAKETVGWTSKSLVSAIRTHALPSAP